MSIIATVLQRMDDDRVSVAIPSYDFPHSVADRIAKKGQNIELIGSHAHR
ncbi:hypothetical protein ACFX5Q_05640 [Mesorhizobium sp. IMUNJ 23033]